MCCHDVCMVDPKYLSIPVRMGIIGYFRRSNHNEATAGGVYRILVAADVVCGIVN